MLLFFLTAKADVDAPEYLTLPRCGYRVETTSENLCFAWQNKSDLSGHVSLIFFRAGQDGLPPESYRDYGHYRSDLLAFTSDGSCPTGSLEFSTDGDAPPADYQKLAKRVVATVEDECFEHVLIGSEVRDRLRSFRVQKTAEGAVHLKDMGTFLTLKDGRRIPAAADASGSPLVRAEKLSIQGLSQFPDHDFYVYQQGITPGVHCTDATEKNDYDGLVGTTIVLTAGSANQLQLGSCDNIGLLVTQKGEDVYSARPLWSGGWLPASQPARDLTLRLVADAQGAPVVQNDVPEKAAPILVPPQTVPPQTVPPQTAPVLPPPTDQTTVTLTPAFTSSPPVTRSISEKIWFFGIPLLGLATLIGVRLARR